MSEIKQKAQARAAQVRAWLQQVGHDSKTMAQQNLPILGIFLLMGAIALWHTLPQFATALIGQDSSATIWNFWWPRRALWLNFDIMITDHTVFPFEQNQLLSLSPVFSVLLLLVTRLPIPIPLAFNSLYLISLMFTGWAMWVYLRQRRFPQPIVLLTSVLFTFSPLMLVYLWQGRPDLLALGWLPLGCLVLDHIQAKVSGKRGMILFLIGWGAVLTSFTVSKLAFVVWLPYLGSQIWQTQASDRRLLIDHVLWQGLLLLAVCMTYPLPGVLKTLGNLAPGVMPSSLPTALLTLSTSLILLGITWGLLITIALINRNGGTERWFWAGLTAVPLGIALISHFHGTAPQSLFAPADWLIPASFAGCLLIATSLTPFWEHRAATKSAPLIVVSLLVAVIAVQAPPPTLPWQHPDVYQAIGRESGDYAILDVPFGVRSLPTGRTLGTGADFEQYAVVHKKRTLVGTLTRPGEDVFETYARSPLFQYLAGAGTTVAPDVAPAFQATIQKQRIGYVIAHPMQLKETGQLDRIDFLNAQASLCKVFESPIAIAYRTSWHPFACNKPLQ